MADAARAARVLATTLRAGVRVDTSSPIDDPHGADRAYNPVRGSAPPWGRSPRTPRDSESATHP